MYLSKASIEEHKVALQFKELRQLLLDEQYADRIQKSLAYWALPSDRGLPLALMGRTVKEILETPFEQIYATRGIGEKKIVSLMRLLSRAITAEPAPSSFEILKPVDGEAASAGIPDEELGADFDVATLSELTWTEWRACVVRHNLGNEPLGRFSPSLKDVTRVIWNTPLETYLGLTLAELRSLRTYGAKRVRSVVEVFHTLYQLLGKVGPHGHLSLRIMPRSIDSIEQWIYAMLNSRVVPSAEEIRRNLVMPLLEQIKTDASDQIAYLAESRLGMNDVGMRVRQAAREMGLTRARIYQLLGEVNHLVTVRWPCGERLLNQLRQKFELEAEGEANYNFKQFYAVINLCYCGSNRTIELDSELSDDEADEVV
ncbi:MAG: hypothetical protein ACYC35_05155 [Pirellulales bacterium]|jgi:hypothetical protein